MKVWLVIDQVDGIVEGVWSCEAHAEEYAAQFAGDNYYDMQVIEYYVRDSPFGPQKEEEGR